MISIVFNFKYLSQDFIKLSMQGVFWNPEDEQILKLFWVTNLTTIWGSKQEKKVSISFWLLVYNVSSGPFPFDNWDWYWIGRAQEHEWPKILVITNN